MRGRRRSPASFTDPGDSNTVYVAALGRLWGENPERGVYVTHDGGASWALSLKVDARTGACDLVMDPANPQVLYAALHARRRTPWSFSSGGTSGGIFKTADGGRTWKKLTQGLPAGTGRIGLDVYRKDPRVIYAVVESDEGGQIATFDSRSRSGGVFRSEDGGEHWSRLGPWAPRPFCFSQIRVQPDDDKRVYLLGVDLWVSDDAGRTFRAGGGKNLHPDFHAMWIDPANGDHVLTGTDGGLFLSHDRTASWDYINNLAVGEFYNLAVDLREPYRVYGGLQDNQTWGGPSQTRFNSESWLDESRHDGITNGDWYCLGGGDGFHVAVDPTDPDIVYYESQGGSLQRVNLATGKERFLRPAAREGSPEYRFNWNAPFALSPHDPSVLWMGGNHLFRLYERGDKWEEASPDLTTGDPKKMVTAGSGAEAHCTIVTLAESPLSKGLVWVGTDDGKVWLTRDAGAHWSDLTANLHGVPPALYMSRIEASHHEPGTAYLAVDGHRSDLFRPYLFVTRDFGKTWSSISGDLPAHGPVKVVRESPGNRDLLFAGTEFGLFMSLDRGARWIKAGEGLPTVAVDDIIIHPRERDLIAGTQRPKRPCARRHHGAGAVDAGGRRRAGHAVRAASGHRLPLPDGERALGPEDVHGEEPGLWRQPQLPREGVDRRGCQHHGHGQRRDRGAEADGTRHPRSPPGGLGSPARAGRAAAASRVGQPACFCASRHLHGEAHLRKAAGAEAERDRAARTGDGRPGALKAALKGPGSASDYERDLRPAGCACAGAQSRIPPSRPATLLTTVTPGGSRPPTSRALPPPR